MTDLQIDRALALAIGWRQEQMHVSGSWLYVHFAPSRSINSGWRRLFHKDPTVIWPIAERFDCFPYVITFGVWRSRCEINGQATFRIHINPCTAVALAVIAAHGGGK